ncbi:tRNA (guanosine(37)-N1)-methyltransferase TrmD [Thiotrichales bacterium HSG1]|nr:tRNA (guanosine(37)-N1)-methyltransferase TrmD [Thiotrichales bacterium HSG1]
MHIGIVSIFPEMFTTLTCGGITARALKRKLFKLSIWNPRDFTNDKNRRVDDRPYGGGPGMVLQVQPLRKAISSAVDNIGIGTKVIYLSPQGRRLDQTGIHTLLNYQNMVLVAGRYEGIDERLIEQDVDELWSIGDYVLSGGELAAMVIIDALVRQLPQALGHEESAKEESFYAGLLDHPHYTRPEEIDGQKVPPVLLSGDHAKIAEWRRQQALERTKIRHPELLDKLTLSSS